MKLHSRDKTQSVSHMQSKFALRCPLLCSLLIPPQPLPISPHCVLITWLFSLINSDLDRNPPWSLSFFLPISLAGLWFPSYPRITRSCWSGHPSSPGSLACVKLEKKIQHIPKCKLCLFEPFLMPEDGCSPRLRHGARGKGRHIPLWVSPSLGRTLW